MKQPRWLSKKGRIDEAREILSMLRGEPSDSPSIAHQIEEIEASLQETGQGSFRDIFFETDRHGSRIGHSSLSRRRWDSGFVVGMPLPFINRQFLKIILA